MTPPKIKTSAKKKYFTISYTYYMKLVRFYLPLPISVAVIVITAIPQHTTISPIPCTAHNITSGEMHCHAAVIHTN